jgi:hypothetical protein
MRPKWGASVFIGVRLTPHILHSRKRGPGRHPLPSHSIRSFCRCSRPNCQQISRLPLPNDRASANTRTNSMQPLVARSPPNGPATPPVWPEANALHYNSPIETGSSCLCLTCRSGGQCDENERDQAQDLFYHGIPQGKYSQIE